MKHPFMTDQGEGAAAVGGETSFPNKRIHFILFLKSLSSHALLTDEIVGHDIVVPNGDLQSSRRQVGVFNIVGELL